MEANQQAVQKTLIWCKKNYSILIVIFAVLFLLILVLILQERAVIQPHDNLESNAVYVKMMKESGTFFSFRGEVPFLGGISRNYMPPSFLLYNLIYYIIPSFWAYITVFFLKIVLGVVSFTLLFKAMLKKEKYEANRNIIILVGFAFSILWGHPANYFSAASLPLIAYLFIKVYRNPKSIIYYILIFLYPMLSNLFLYGLFICGYILIFMIYDLIKNKSVKLLPAFLILIVGYIAVEYRFFYTVLVENQLTIKETIKLADISFSQFESIFLFGHYHSESRHYYIILPSVLIYLLIDNALRIINKKSLLTYTNLGFILIIINALIYWGYQTEAFRNIVYTILPPIQGLNFSRTIFLNPILWYCLFAFVIISIFEKRKVFAAAIAFAQICIILISNCIYNDVLHTAQKYLPDKISILSEEGNNRYTYEEFYSEELFDEIKEDINYNNEYSVAFRFHPGVLNQNSIATLDGYMSYYPLEYKSTFRSMAVEQLEQNKVNLVNFDDWGGRAYLFSAYYSAADYNSYKVNNLIGDGEEDLFLNIDEFKRNGGKYIFSNGRISNADDLGVELAGVYTDEISLYRIYVYIAD